MFVDSNQKGDIAELAIATEAAKLGLSVLKPLTEHGRYDLVLETAGRLLRVQCKWANRKGDVVAVNLSSSRRGPRGFVRRNYSPSEVDAIAAYCADLDQCFLIPIEGLPANRVCSCVWSQPEMDSARHYTLPTNIDSGL